MSSKEKPRTPSVTKKSADHEARDETQDGEVKLSDGKTKKAEDVFDLVRNCDGNPECWLLLGAGCSYPEVPLAPEFVEIIKKKYPHYFKNAKEPKGYAQCMHVLPIEFRRKIIRENIEKARIVEAYIAIAALVDEGYIHKILTVNFDPLLLKACALVGRIPAVYDLAASLYGMNDVEKFRPTLATPAIVHLHGQNEGIVLINDPKEAEVMSKRLGWLFEGAEKHVWVVAGYSGDNDPVFKRLSETAQFDAGLFWMRHDNQMPCKEVVDLIEKKHGTSVIFNQPPNSFFPSLAKELGCYPPQVLYAPLDHIEDRLKTQLSESCQEAVAQTIQYIEEAREAIKNDAATKTLQIQSFAQAGEFEKAFSAFKKIDEPESNPKLLAIVVQSIETTQQLAKVHAYAQKVGIESDIVESLRGRGLIILGDSPDLVLNFLDTLPPSNDHPRQRKVVLSNTRVTDEGLVHLKSFTNLQELLLTDTKISDKGLEYLKSCKQIHTLLINGTPVTDDGMVYLKSLTRLQKLALSRSQVTDKGLVHLKLLTELQALFLVKMRVTDFGIEHLKELHKLKELSLKSTQVTDAGLKHLMGLTSLRLLSLNGTQVTNAGVAELKKALPKCIVRS